MNYQIMPTRAGLRLTQHGTVLSEVRKTPGPTHSVADVLAAATVCLGKGAGIVLLGFAGGGMVAPLRAMGDNQRIEAVDLDGSGWRLFKRTCGEWADPVNFHLADACRWLDTRKKACNLIIEDLSVVEHGDVHKPAITWSMLPPLIRRRLSRAGVAIYNLLPPKNARWAEGYRHVIDPRQACRVVEFSDFENRLVIVARTLPTARKLSFAMGQQLRSIGSRQAGRVSIRAACASCPDIRVPAP